MVLLPSRIQIYILSRKLQVIKKPIAKSSFWIFWNSFFGLGVLIHIMLFKSVFNNTTEVYKKLTTEYILHKILEEGIIIFFCKALMAACMIDYILSKVDYGKIFVSLMFVGLMMSFTLTCLIFGSTYLFESSNINQSFLNYF